MSQFVRAATILLIGVLLVPAWAFNGKASAAGIDCSQRYAYLYQNFGGGGGSRLFCVGSDRDIEGEPGNVMGPLGDDPATFLNDFDTNPASSGVSSVKVHDAAGGSTWGLWFYANKDFGGCLLRVLGKRWTCRPCGPVHDQRSRRVA